MDRFLFKFIMILPPEIILQITKGIRVFILSHQGSAGDRHHNAAAGETAKEVRDVDSGGEVLHRLPQPRHRPGSNRPYHGNSLNIAGRRENVLLQSCNLFWNKATDQYFLPHCGATGTALLRNRGFSIVKVALVDAVVHMSQVTPKHRYRR